MVVYVRSSWSGFFIGLIIDPGQSPVSWNGSVLAVEVLMPAGLRIKDSVMFPSGISPLSLLDGAGLDPKMPGSEWLSDEATVLCLEGVRIIPSCPSREIAGIASSPVGPIIISG